MTKLWAREWAARISWLGQWKGALCGYLVFNAERIPTTTATERYGVVAPLLNHS